MNKRGQALITFVLMLPLIVVFLAFFIDSIRNVLEKNRIDGIITSNVEIILDKNIRDESEIVKIIQANDHSLEVNVQIMNDDLKIIVKGQKKNIFGNIYRLKYLDMKFDYCANYVEKRINKECAG